MSLMSGSRWWYLTHKKVKSWDPTTWYRIWQFQTPADKWNLQMHLLDDLTTSYRVWQFQTPAEKWYLQMHLLDERFNFWGVMIRVFWKRESRPIKWHQCGLLNRQLFFCFHIYSLCLYLRRSRLLFTHLEIWDFKKNPKLPEVLNYRKSSETVLRETNLPASV
jgi:hypothetical protein